MSVSCNYGKVEFIDPNELYEKIRMKKRKKLWGQMMQGVWCKEDDNLELLIVGLTKLIRVGIHPIDCGLHRFYIRK